MKAETTKQNNNGEIAEDGNIDKIRDILFGVQMRDSERKFERMEERLTKEVSDIREDTRKRLDEIQAFIQNEIRVLTERLASEQTQRVESVSMVTNELKDLTQNVEKKVTNVNDQIAKNESEMRQEMLAQSKNFSEELHRRSTEIRQTADRDASELRSDKADRTVLAQLFTDMAMRLTNDLNLPAEMSDD